MDEVAPNAHTAGQPYCEMCEVKETDQKHFQDDQCRAAISWEHNESL